MEAAQGMERAGGAGTGPVLPATATSRPQPVLERNILWNMCWLITQTGLTDFWLLLPQACENEKADGFRESLREQ